jgi:hypothetical protein
VKTKGKQNNYGLLNFVIRPDLAVLGPVDRLPLLWYFYAENGYITNEGGLPILYSIYLKNLFLEDNPTKYANHWYYKRPTDHFIVKKGKKIQKIQNMKIFVKRFEQINFHHSVLLRIVLARHFRVIAFSIIIKISLRHIKATQNFLWEFLMMVIIYGNAVTFFSA